MTELEHAIKHIKTRADAWAVKEVTEALRSISERLEKALSQEPCDDAISREAVYSILKEYHIDEEEIESAMDDCQNLTVNAITSDVSLLPSVNPQKSGKWIKSLIYENTYNCSKCGSAGYDTFKYCPNCGAKMEREVSNG